MKAYTFKFYSDPGHGWLAVKRSLLFSLCIQDKISIYSYQKGNTVYLEEDMDAGVLLTAIKTKNIPYTILEKSTNNRSPIRSYNRYMV